MDNLDKAKLIQTLQEEIASLKRERAVYSIPEEPKEELESKKDEINGSEAEVKEKISDHLEKLT